MCTMVATLSPAATSFSESLSTLQYANRAKAVTVKAVRNEGKSGKTMRALAWRVGFSAMVFVFILVSMMMGWIQPHDVNPTTRGGVPIEQQ